MLIRAGVSPIATLPIAFLAGALAGMVTGLLNTALGIPGILASILTQISLYSINLNIMGKANQPVSVDNYPLVVSLRYVTDGSVSRLLFFLGMIVFLLALIAVMYWYFGTEQGHAIRATGCNGNMARAQGINTNFIKVLALMISNGLVGLCGALYGQSRGHRMSIWDAVLSLSVWQLLSSVRFSSVSLPARESLRSHLPWHRLFWAL